MLLSLPLVRVGPLKIKIRLFHQPQLQILLAQAPTSKKDGLNQLATLIEFHYILRLKKNQPLALQKGQNFLHNISLQLTKLTT